MSKIAPYGSWSSPISAKSVANGSARFDFTQTINGNSYWVESRPWESGRSVIVQRQADGKLTDITPKGFSARSKVHEYGGKPYLVINDILVFSRAEDNLLYRIDLKSPDLSAKPTPKDRLYKSTELRFADFCVSPLKNHIISVVEAHHPDSTVDNLIADICLETGTISKLCEGADFYAFPRLSPNKQQLCWVSWNHPNMPWDETRLSIGELEISSNTVRLVNKQTIVDNQNEAIFQPQWLPDGELLCISDRSNWWNLYQYSSGESLQAIHPMTAECATPLWVLGMSTSAVNKAGEIVFCFSQHGSWHLAKLINGEKHTFNLPFTDIYSLSIEGSILTFIAAAPDTPTAVYQLDIDKTSSYQQISTPIEAHPKPYLSIAESFQFRTTDDDISNGFFYPPYSKDYQVPKDEKPPLIIICHGGPTGATTNAYNEKVQFWTSRGFAVADINYRGSTGFGRQYREKLTGLWGQADVEDAINAVKHLANEGVIDPEKAIIRGSSAGGYTTLAALCFHDTFKAGASLYGIGNLETLATDTHKFESHYLDKLIGPYPEDMAIYHKLSPCHHGELLNSPVIFFQGLLDKVVPPEQSETMYKLLKAKGQTTRYVTYADEAHGFRKADNIESALNEELEFYQQVFQFTKP